MPTSTRDLAEGLERLFAPEAKGIFHLTQSSPEPVSWHRYAVEVVQAMAEQGLIATPVPVTARRMADIPALRSNRPIDTAMTPRRLKTERGHTMRDWKDALRDRVRELAERA
jgi:dTDP-4-dehydrorhamnose reductase